MDADAAGADDNDSIIHPPTHFSLTYTPQPNLTRSQHKPNHSGRTPRRSTPGKKPPTSCTSASRASRGRSSAPSWTWSSSLWSTTCRCVGGYLCWLVNWFVGLFISLCMCMCVYVYIDMCVCMRVCIRACVFWCTSHSPHDQNGSSPHPPFFIRTHKLKHSQTTCSYPLPPHPHIHNTHKIQNGVDHIHFAMDFAYGSEDMNRALEVLRPYINETKVRRASISRVCVCVCVCVCVFWVGQGAVPIRTIVRLLMLVLSLWCLGDAPTRSCV
jgi:hypothetical protein